MNKKIIWYVHINTSVDNIKFQLSVLHEPKSIFKKENTIRKGYKAMISVIEILDDSNPDNAEVKFIEDLAVCDINVGTKLSKKGMEAAVKEANNNLIGYLDELVKLNLITKDGYIYNPIIK